MASKTEQVTTSAERTNGRFGLGGHLDARSSREMIGCREGLAAWRVHGDRYPRSTVTPDPFISLERVFESENEPYYPYERFRRIFRGAHWKNRKTTARSSVTGMDGRILKRSSNLGREFSKENIPRDWSWLEFRSALRYMRRNCTWDRALVNATQHIYMAGSRAASQRASEGRLLNVRFTTASRPFSAKHVTEADEHVVCWHCNAPRVLLRKSSASVPESAFVCVECGRIQPNLPPGIDYFSLFGIPERFLIDESVLERRFREWQRRLHPDKFAGQQRGKSALGSEDAHAQLQYAEQASALVNAAHDVLKSPHTRAVYMLAERGVTLEPNRDDASELREMAPDFLEEMLVLREELDEAEQTRERLGAVVDRITEAKSRLCQELNDAFEGSGGGDERALHRCRDLVARLQFYHRLEIAAKERL